MTAPPREPVFCPQRKKPCIAGCPYPSECPEPAPSAERAEAERDAANGRVRATDNMRKQMIDRAERAEAECDALRECVRAADAMALECRRVGLISSTWLEDYDDARAKVKP